MDLDNYIEAQYRDLQPNIDIEYGELYNEVDNSKLREIFATLHYLFICNYKLMNQRLPTDDYTAHFWADPSRELSHAIEIAVGIQRALCNSKYAFKIDPYYDDLIKKSQNFLKNSGGSEIPMHMEKVELYYTLPIFISQNTIAINQNGETKTYKLTTIGEGSYATVYKYKDIYYQEWFAIKRAKKDLDAKELLRFKKEFGQMHELSSPYIVKVFSYDEVNNQYIMELMDCTLYEYIRTNNSKLSSAERKIICNQIFRAFQYIHSKGLLHRDISPKNILLRLYDNVTVVKVSDFGLVKIPDSDLTSVNTEFKGYLNDPSLKLEGFASYTMVHETYALTNLVYYIMTGKTNTEKITSPDLRLFVEKGLSPDKNKRFQSIDELIKGFRAI